MPYNVHFERRDETGRLQWARFLVAGSRKWHCEDLPATSFVLASPVTTRTHSELDRVEADAHSMT